MKRDYYDVLGLPRDADDKAVKAAYRRLARKYHPDVNPNDPQAEAKFKEVGEAYAVLSDPERRKKYDRLGQRWDQAEAYGDGPFTQDVDLDFGTIFGSIFGGLGGGASEGFTRGRSVQPKDVERTIDVTLEEIDSGTSRSLSFQSEDVCETCRGLGMVSMADSPRRATCPTCSGAGTSPRQRRIQVSIPAGFEDGKKLRVPGGGTTGSAGRAGDLFVTVRVLPHKTFRRRGEDTETEVDVPFTVAALGGQVRVPTPRASGHISVPPGTQTGQVFRLKGQGVSRLGGGRGDLLARVRVTVPSRLTDRQRQLLEEFARTEADA